MKSSYEDFFKAAKSASGKEKKKVLHKPKKAPSKGPGPLTSKTRKKSPNNSIITVLFLLFGLVGSGWAYLNLDQVVEFIENIRVSPITVLEAASSEEEKKGPDKKGEVAKNSDSTKVESKKESNDEDKFSEENISHYSKLQQRKKELDQRESELNELESELHKQRKEIEARILKLEEIRSQIGRVLKDKVEVDEERVNKLVDFYSNMKPQNAAKIIATLNEDLAVEILGKMKKKNAADILNLLKPEKAQVITEKFAGYKRR